MKYLNFAVFSAAFFVGVGIYFGVTKNIESSHTFFIMATIWMAADWLERQREKGSLK